MISRALAILTMAYSSLLYAFDVCDQHGFEKFGGGWIRSISNSKGTYVDFKVNLIELENEGVDVGIDVAPSLAKDRASNAYYKFFKSISPPPFEGADLEFSSTESFSAICRFTRTFGYRTPLNSFKWVEKAGESEVEMLPAVKDFVRKRHFIN